MENRWTDRAALMVLTGLMTAYLRGFVEPPGEWHGWPCGLFVVVVWPSLTWLLRSLKRWGFWHWMSGWSWWFWC